MWHTVYKHGKPIFFIEGEKWLNFFLDLRKDYKYYYIVQGCEPDLFKSIKELREIKE